jgi:hypothetical protein
VTVQGTADFIGLAHAQVHFAWLVAALCVPAIIATIAYGLVTLRRDGAESPRERAQDYAERNEA